MSARAYGILSAAVGIVTGYVTIHSPLRASWHSIFPWIVVGLLLLYCARDRKIAVVSGAVFGFFRYRLVAAIWLRRQ